MRNLTPNPRSVRSLTAAAVGAALLASSLVAQTNVGGLISANTTWTRAGSPYVMTRTVTVGGGAILTIEAGVEVRGGTGLALVVGDAFDGIGTLVARGTAGQRIRFTASATRWGGIRLLDLATDNACVLEHCLIESVTPAGTGAIDAIGSSPLVQDCEIRDCPGYGIYFDHGSGTGATPGAQIRNCLVRTTSSTGIHVSSGGPHTIRDCVSEQGIYAYASVGGVTCERNTVLGNGTLHAQANGPCTVRGNLVDGASGMNVSAPQGSVVENNTVVGCSGTALTLNGGLVASRNVVSANRTTAVQLSGTVAFRDNQVVGNTGAGIYVTGSVFVERNVVSYNRQVGIYGSGGATITDNLINDNTGSGGGGLYMNGPPAAFARNTIARNTATKGGGIYAQANVGSIAVSASTDANTFLGNVATGRDANQNPYGPDIYFAGGSTTSLDARNNCHAGPGLAADRIYDRQFDSSLGRVNYSILASCDPFADLGLGRAAAGVAAPRLTATGTLAFGSPASWSVAGAPTNAAGVLLVSPSRDYLPFAGGFVIPSLGGPNLQIPVTTDGTGNWTFSIASLPRMARGVALYTQVFVYDPRLPVFPFAFSNGLVAERP